MAELTVDLTYGSALYEAAEDVGNDREDIRRECMRGISEFPLRFDR